MASTYLIRTLADPGGAGNRNKWTFSAWIKRSELGTQQWFFGSYQSGNYQTAIKFQSDDSLQFYDYYNGSFNGHRRTNRLFRDTSAWYHIVCIWDKDNATTSEKMRVFVNGTEETSFQASSDPSNATTLNADGQDISIGYKETVGEYFNGVMAHAHFCDGYAYDSSYFGETDSTTGIWKPKTAPSVTYGTNGFFLKFASAGSLGTDSSGNGNNFTLNGSGTQTQDTPSNVFATINPLNSSETSTTNFFTSLGNTELTATDNDSTRQMGITLNPENMKGYFEMKVAVDNNWQIHVQDITRRVTKTPYDNSSNPTYRYNNAGSISYGNGSGWTNLIASYTSGSSTGDIIGVAFDFTGSNKNVWFHLNGTYGNNGSGVGNPATGDYPALTASNLNTADHYAFLFSVNTTSSDSSVQANFGNGYFGTTAVSSAQSPSDGIGLFEYEVPSGYKALCTKSINAQEYS